MKSNWLVALAVLTACSSDPEIGGRDGGAGVVDGSLVVGDGGGFADAGPRGDAGPLPTVTGHAYYAVGDRAYRIAVAAGAAPFDVSAALDAHGPGTRDRWITASPDGTWLVLAADRGGCGGECLVRVPGDLSRVEAVMPDGVELYPEGTPAITQGGDRIVFSSRDGPHETDLWITTLSGTTWSTPVLLTAAATRPYNNMPALDRDGTRAYFDCGQEPYPEGGNNDACSVGLDGSGFAIVTSAAALPDARQTHVQNPHPHPDGVLFEAAWPIGEESPETIWLLPTGGGAPQPIGRTFGNAVSPCALADGRFLFLWLARPGNDDGKHELALAARDGTILHALTPGVDVADIGLGCSD